MSRPPDRLGLSEPDGVAELERQRRRSDLLLGLSSALSSMQDGVEIARAVCGYLRDASGAPFSMFARREPGSDQFSIIATEGLAPAQVEQIRATIARPDRPSLQELLRGGAPKRAGEEAVGHGLGIERAMGAPISMGGRTEGFIAIGAPTGAVVRDEEWLELLLAFAALTATALARADAVGELARQRDLLASQVEEQTRSLRTAVDELRRASDAKTEFLANVSHELRTPLTSILGFVEVLAGGIDGQLNPDQQRDIETVQASSRRLLELIDDLIDVASIESGRLQLQIGPVDAGAIVREAAETIGPLATEKAIELEVDVVGGGSDGDRPILAAADRGWLREIVLNLLSNAMKFTAAGGRVRIGVARAPGPDEGPSMVEISVRDTGIGIEPGDLERIFEKFVRIATAATPGTGLGLAIARELARLHGGDLTVESTVGTGSRFVVRIPEADKT